MEKSNNHQSSMPATTADLSALKTEIIAAVKDSVQGLATQETVSAVMEAVAETKERVTDLTGLMKEMLEDLTATHEDVRYVRTTVTTLARSDAAHEAAIESLRKRVERVERKVGIAK
jgi:ABC-type transporter Mla subunit MlaD